MGKSCEKIHRQHPAGEGWEVEGADESIGEEDGHVLDSHLVHSLRVANLDPICVGEHVSVDATAEIRVAKSVDAGVFSERFSVSFAIFLLDDFSVRVERLLARHRHQHARVELKPNDACTSKHLIVVLLCQTLELENSGAFRFRTQVLYRTRDPIVFHLALNLRRLRAHWCFMDRRLSLKEFLFSEILAIPGRDNASVRHTFILITVIFVKLILMDRINGH